MPLKIRLIKSNPTTAPGHGPSTEFFLPVLGSVLTAASHWTCASHSRSTALQAAQASQPLPCFSLSCTLTPPHPLPTAPLDGPGDMAKGREEQPRLCYAPATPLCCCRVTGSQNDLEQPSGYSNLQ